MVAPNTRLERLSNVLVLACSFLMLRQADGFTTRCSGHRHQINGNCWGIMRSSLTELENEQPTSPSAASTVTVSYEGQSCEITVFPEETILASLERQSQHLKSHLTALPEMPSDCRRGNCLTCAASCNNTLQPSALLVVHDGLSPAMSRLVADKGYVLTCSSYVVAQSSGLQLQLGKNHQLWQEVYASPGRFTTQDAQLAARSAMARVIRKSAERNVEEWALETEKVLRNTEE